MKLGVKKYTEKCRGFLVANFLSISPGKIDFKFVTESFTTFFTARKEICHLELTLGASSPNSSAHSNCREDRRSLAIFNRREIAYLGASNIAKVAILWGVGESTAATAENRAILAYSASTWTRSFKARSKTGKRQLLGLALTTAKTW